MKKQNNGKILLAASASFLIPFGGFLILFFGRFSNIFYHSKLAHSILLTIIAVLAFYVCYTAFQAYEKQKDARIFIVALSFYVFGFSFLLHGVAVPDFYIFTEEIFDITEHYGLFLGGLLLLGLAFPWGFSKKIYEHRIKIFLGLMIFLLVSFIAIVVFPSAAKILDGAENFFIILTGAFFFAAPVFLSVKYREKKNTLLFYLIIAFSIMINAAIIPLFYDEWNIIWWYFHFVFSAAFVVILLGLKRISGKEGFETVLGEMPLFVKIGTKIVAFMIVLSVVPLVITGFLVFYSSKNTLEKQIFEDLTALAYSKQGQVLAYLDAVEVRTKDFSSDGFIRDSLKEIISAPSENTVQSLSYHLIHNKKALDENIIGIFIIDNKGNIVASTDASEIGDNESTDEYFIKGLKEVYIAEVYSPNRHFQTARERVMIVSAPLTDKTSGEILGVIVNFFKMEKLQKILSGEFQADRSGSAADSDLAKNIEIYVVDKQKQIFVHPQIERIASLSSEQSVDTVPVRACLENGRGMTGIYSNYNEESVIGAAMCVKDRGWIILVEKNQIGALATIFNLERTLALIIITAALIVIIIGLYFSRRLTRPIEQLTQAAEKISAGDLDKRAPVFSNDEVGVLARSFNQMTENLVRTREFPENIIRSMGDCLIAVDPSFKIIKTNQAALELLGYQTDELLNQPIEKIFDPEINPIVESKKFSELFKSGFAKDIEADLQTKEGEKIPASISAAAMQDRQNKIVGIVFVAKDIRIYKEVDRAKSEFISIAAHQLRTPLSIIKWTFRMLTDNDFGELQEEQRKVLNDGNLVVENMVKLVSDLLDVARIEEGRFVLKIEPIMLEKVISDAISTFGLKLREKQQEIKFITRGIIPSIEADYNKIHLVVENLIDNAIKYSYSGGIIAVELEKRGNSVEIRVKDSGIGIPAAEAEKIFTKFFRSKNAARKETMGSGLGLYIVKRILEMHNGRIKFISEKNKGTAFIINLPIKHTALA